MMLAEPDAPAPIEIEYFTAPDAKMQSHGMALDLRGEAEWWEWWAAKWTTPQQMNVPDCLGR